MQIAEHFLESEALVPIPNQAALAPPMFSIIGPVYNEEELLAQFCQRMIEVMEALVEPFEIVLVNDGSRDHSPEIMRQLHTQDPRIKVIHFSRNFGLQAALTAGLDYASGQAVIIMDTDLQDPPEVVPQLIERWREGYQVVYAQRAERSGETWFKKFTASMFYRLLARITNVNIPVDTGEFRLIDRKVVDAIKSMREYNRFMRGLSVWVGYKQIGVIYERHARMAGETKFPLRRMMRLAIDGITSFSYLPLQLATYLGFVLALFSAFGIIVAMILRLSGSEALKGQATVLVVVLFIGGIQLLFLGVIGEYLGRIYDEVKRRPLYIVADQSGFGEDTPH